ALLGPNGAGKTTVLRALAGLLPLAEGRVVLDGQVLEDVGPRSRARVRVPAERRPVGMVFQDYLLFPHLSAVENVAFGLRSRGMRRGEARRVAAGWLARLGLAGIGDARPGTLSGGQQQRVALARALATDPRMLLLDEPLAALDVSIRADVRRDLRRRLREFAGVNLLVTHDPLEAIALADRLIVMEGGRVVQAGTPAEVTERPRSAYVADLVGVNLLRGRAADGAVELAGGGRLGVVGADAGEVFAVIPPRSVSLWRSRPDGSPRNVWRGRASGLDLLGDRVRVRIEGEPPVVAEVTPAAVAELRLAEGTEVWVSVKATDVRVYPA
ncbi:MAG TPA: ABC transporter ATP-binding protein, partial [Candidatus Dormibacteraeota bacterium]